MQKKIIIKNSYYYFRSKNSHHLRKSRQQFSTYPSKLMEIHQKDFHQINDLYWFQNLTQTKCIIWRTIFSIFIQKVTYCWKSLNFKIFIDIYLEHYLMRKKFWILFSGISLLYSFVSSSRLVTMSLNIHRFVKWF